MGAGLPDHPIENKNAPVPFEVREADEFEVQESEQKQRDAAERQVESLVSQTMTKTADD